MTLVYTVLIGLASYRIWRLLAEDTILEPFRLWLPDWDWIGDWLYCPWCSGSWVAFGLTWIVDAVAGLRMPVLVGLAAAVIVGWVAENL